MTRGADPRTMARPDFVAGFGHVFEHSPWIAEAAFGVGLPEDAATAKGLHRALCAALRTAPRDCQQALIEAHPDLAGRLARAGGLTAESTREQASVALDRLSDAEYAQFTALNAAYRERFDMPFVMAVKGRTKDDVLEGFRRRITNDAEAEFAEALAQVERIALLRLKNLLP